MLLFDHERAYRLYKALFGQVEELIEGKHLLLVPSGPLTQLPFQVLVTASSESDDHRAVAWLARSHALTVLPAVSSLKALRPGHPSAAPKPVIGFGNPLLDGDQADPIYGNNANELAKLARKKQTCPKTAWERVAALFASQRGVTPMQTRGGLADVSLARMQNPVPDTADELCALARDLGADAAELHLGAHAVELPAGARITLTDRTSGTPAQRVCVGAYEGRVEDCPGEMGCTTINWAMGRCSKAEPDFKGIAAGGDRNLQTPAH